MRAWRAWHSHELACTRATSTALGPRRIGTRLAGSWARLSHRRLSRPDKDVRAWPKAIVLVIAHPASHMTLASAVCLGTLQVHVRVAACAVEVDLHASGAQAQARWRCRGTMPVLAAVREAATCSRVCRRGW